MTLEFDTALDLLSSASTRPKKGLIVRSMMATLILPGGIKCREVFLNERHPWEPSSNAFWEPATINGWDFLRRADLVVLDDGTVIKNRHGTCP